ncbi:uncharacterized protein LOC143904644 [Temnothorax americanus]|uniref:uncharacterized protein LOC143904644 n=1 Tax=Temnothorax americanus TaxID=1964332 RepID=UPI0040676474
MNNFYRSSRESYGDEAIGYVCLKRDGSLGTCIIKCKVCPEHRVRNKGYSVTLTIHEKDEKVIDVECHDCAASSGGCKHAIAFLMWMHRKSENPSVTEVECYWRRSSLASVGTSKKYIELKELGKTDVVDAQLPDNSSFLKALLDKAKEKQLDSQLSRHNFILEDRKLMSLSIHQLLLNFCEKESSSADDFLEYASKEMSEDSCRMAEKLTRSQSDTVTWHELRYGRVTASRIYEAAHCKTLNGTFVQQIIGASKIFDSQAMQRGKRLEKEVLVEVGKITRLPFKDCGLILLPSFPVLGASPDAIGDDFVVEVKCPSSSKTFDQFLPHEEINEKCKAQINMQMFATGKKRGLFCVANPKFEESRQVTVVREDFDEHFTKSIIEHAVAFWKNYIFSKIIHYS